MCESSVKEAVGGMSCAWLVCIWNVFAGEFFTISGNCLTLAGTVLPGSSRPKISKHQIQKLENMVITFWQSGNPLLWGIWRLSCDYWELSWPAFSRLVKIMSCHTPPFFMPMSPHCIISLIRSFNKHLLSTHDKPGTVSDRSWQFGRRDRLGIK